MPLCKLQESLETANKGQDSSVSINDLIKFVTQSIILVEQTKIALPYHRRLTAFDGVMKKSTIQAKSMLKNKFELLQKKDEDLFGKEFPKKMSEIVKARKQSKELLVSIVFEDVASKNQPFLKGSLPRNQHRGEQSSCKNNSKQKNWNFNGKKSTLVNMQMKATFFKEISTLISREKLPYIHKLVKSLVSSGQLPSFQIAGRLKHL